MTILRPELVTGDQVSMNITNPKHMVPTTGKFTVGGVLTGGEGGTIAALGNMIGTDGVTQTGSFEDAMLQALDSVSASQQFSSALTEAAIIDPDSVDVHDLTIAQAKATMSLNIARTVLNRLVQGWKDIINTR
jgi:flagellar hook-basal body complex protein FliE